MTAVKELEAYAADNYEAGGHWVVECYDHSDYQAVLDRASNDLDEAKALLKQYWQLVSERERDCQWS